ncbi:MAG: D-tyrosyl-tRNA(Tyr) deacylase [Verrucomicrobiaceae bacterium]|nr:D-tyrosyl-tRNA(Tyr) deacylase [Verrucomicrobiaceae bacterium]
MKALLQRVTSAHVSVDDEIIGRIDKGLLVLLGVEKHDGETNAIKLLEKLLAYRIFPDEQQRMNRNVAEAGGGLLIVSQFTLAADTSKGLRPSFSSAAAPDEARRLYEWFLAELAQRHQPLACGRFGANMQVHLINDGPVTFLLET